MCRGDIRVIAGNANRPLAEDIAKHLEIELCETVIDTFADGEVSAKISESVRGQDVFVIQSTSKPVNDNLMELLVLIDALKRASAGRINAVIPYYGYARQDRKAKPREPITAKLVADMLTVAGAHRVITVDLHADQIQGFFNIPVDHLTGVKVIANYMKDKIGDNEEDFVILSPDMGGVTRARKLAEYLKLPIAIIEKRRPKPNQSEVMNIIGDIDGKNCIMIDDMIDTGGTICQAAEALKERGAKDIYGSATHGVLSNGAEDRLQNSVMKEFIITDTIEQLPENRRDKIKILPIGSLVAQCIKRVHTENSVSEMFD